MEEDDKYQEYWSKPRGYVTFNYKSKEIILWSEPRTYYQRDQEEDENIIPFDD